MENQSRLFSHILMTDWTDLSKDLSVLCCTPF